MTTIWGLRSSRTVLVGIAFAAFAIVCIAPLVSIVGAAFAATEGIRQTDVPLVLDIRQRGLLYNTAALGLGTAVLSTLVGGPLGFALARVTLPWKSVLRVALAAPALLPPYVVALAWTYLVAPVGGEWAYSVAGAVVVLTIVCYPLSMLATEVALRRVEPRLEEAALLVARPALVLRRITLPLVAPTMVAGGLVIFVLGISEFGVPGVLRVRVFTTEVFTAFAALYDLRRAIALALPLAAVSLLAAAVAATLTGERMVTTRRGAATESPLTFDGWKQPSLVAVGSVLLVAVLTPLAVLATEAQRSTSIVGAVRGAQTAVMNSLALGAIGATLVTVVATALAYARVRARRPFGRIADVLMVFLFTVPSTVVGVGLIELWNRPGALGAVYGTAAMPVLGYLARFVPVATLIVAAVLRSVPIAHEEASAVSGATWLATIARIVLPQIKPGLLAAWVVSFVLAFGEVGTTILVAPAGESTLPIRVYTLIANAPPGHVAALALFQSVVGLCPLILLAGAIANRETR
jgi:iron(III) transport system permease protein